VGKTTIYEKCRTGELPHFRVGRRIIFSRAALEAKLAGQLEPTQQPRPQLDQLELVRMMLRAQIEALQLQLDALETREVINAD
jgi:excisionase family DNA binding protein